MSDQLLQHGLEWLERREAEERRFMRTPAGRRLALHLRDQARKRSLEITEHELKRAGRLAVDGWDVPCLQCHAGRGEACCDGCPGDSRRAYLAEASRLDLDEEIAAGVFDSDSDAVEP